MKKFLLIAAVVLFVLALIGIFGARLMYQKIVESDDFREQLAEGLTHVTRRFVANSVVDITKINVIGLVDIETGNVNIRSGERAEHVVTIKSALVQPNLWSLITFKAVQFRTELAMVPQGTITIDGRYSLSKLNSAGSDATIEITGKLQNINPVSMTDLMQTSQTDPFFRLTDAVMNGSFQLTKQDSLGNEDEKTFGHLNLDIGQTKWMIASDSKRVIAIDHLPVAATLQDYRISLDKSVKLIDESGTAELSGSIKLPKRRDQEKSWEMQVAVNGSPNLLLIVSKLFKCQTPPAEPVFRVVGPFSRTRCPTSTAD